MADNRKYYYLKLKEKPWTICRTSMKRSSAPIPAQTAAI